MTREENKQATLEALRDGARYARALVDYFTNLELDRSEYPLEEFADGDTQLGFARGTRDEIRELAIDVLGITPEEVDAGKQTVTLDAVATPEGWLCLRCAERNEGGTRNDG